MEYIIVGFGGALGSLVRYTLGRIISAKSGSSYPYATFIINITGAVLLGLLNSLEAEGNAYILIGDGFLGAYTTFSTFMAEGFHFFKEHKIRNAIVYILASLIIGILGYIAGFSFGKAF